MAQNNPSPDRLADAVKKIRDECTKQRKKQKAPNGKPLSIKALATQAKVSPDLVVALENSRSKGKTLDQLIREDEAGPTSRSSLPDRLARIAVVLGLPPESWLNLLRRAKVFRQLQPSDVEVIVKQAQEAVKPKPSTTVELIQKSRTGDDANNTDRATSEEERGAGGRINLRVGLLTAGDHDTGQAWFYDQLSSLILRNVNPRIDVVSAKLDVGLGEQIKTFRDLIEALSRLEYRVVVGPWLLVARTSAYNVDYTPIEGFRHRIAVLTAHREDLIDPSGGPSEVARKLWRRLQTAPAKGEPKPTDLEIHTIAYEAGDLVLRAINGWGLGYLDRLPEYNLPAYAKKLVDATRNSENRVVGVLAEQEAQTVRWFAYKQQEEAGVPPADRVKLIDLAGYVEVSAPRFPVAIATALKDRRFRDAIRGSFRELFVSAPYHLTDIYAKYLLRSLAETLDLEARIANNLDSREHPSPDQLREAETKLLDPRMSWPGYLQIARPRAPGRAAFREALTRTLHDRLTDAKSDRGLFPHEDKQADRVIRKMVPWTGEGTARSLQRLAELLTPELLQKIERLVELLTPSPIPGGPPARLDQTDGGGVFGPRDREGPDEILGQTVPERE